MSGRRVKQLKRDAYMRGEAPSRPQLRRLKRAYLRARRAR